MIDHHVGVLAAANGGHAVPILQKGLANVPTDKSQTSGDKDVHGFSSFDATADDSAIPSAVASSPIVFQRFGLCVPDFRQPRTSCKHSFKKISRPGADGSSGKVLVCGPTISILSQKRAVCKFGNLPHGSLQFVQFRSLTRVGFIFPRRDYVVARRLVV
jgi:hypothetical protein